MGTYLRKLFPSARSTALLGLAVPWLWVVMFYQDPSFLTLLSQSCYHVGFMVCLFAAAGAYYVGRWKELPRALNTVAAGLLCVAPVVTLVPGLQVEWAAPASLLLGGIGCGWCFLGWIEVLFRTSPRRSVCFLMLSASLAALLRFAFVWIPSGFEAAIPLAVLFLCLGYPGMLAAANREVDAYPPAQEARAVRITARKAAVTVVELLVFVLILGMLRGASLEAQSYEVGALLTQALKVLAPILLLVLVAGRSMSDRVILAAQAILLFIVVALLFLALLGERGELVAMALVPLARSVAQLLMLWVLLEFARSSSLPSVTVFGVGRGLYVLAVYAGYVIDKTFGVFSVTEAFNLNLVFFLLACIILFLTARSMRMSRMLRPAEPVSEQLSMEDYVSQRCRIVGSECGLTERETQIAVLLCLGRSVRYIADDLVISENTVRTHAKSLYKKLGIHSKQDLLTVMGVS